MKTTYVVALDFRDAIVELHTNDFFNTKEEAEEHLKVIDWSPSVLSIFEITVKKL